MRLLDNEEIAAVAEAFWALGGNDLRSKNVMERIVKLKFGIWVKYLPDLSLGAIGKWCREKGVSFDTVAEDRDIHGFLMIRGHARMIFLNASDGIADQFFSLAHEIGHFLTEQKLPMDRIRSGLGEGAAKRWENWDLEAEDRLMGTLWGMDLKPQVQLLDHDSLSGIQRATISTAEWNADRLAFELLAPLEELLATATTSKRSSTIEQVARLLTTKFLFPKDMAECYAELVSDLHHGPFSIRDMLGL